MTSIPGKKKLAWYDRSVVVELLAGLSAGAAMVLASYQLYIDPTKRIYSYWTFGIFLLAAFGIVLRIRRGNSSDREKIDGMDHDGIQGAIYVVHAAASYACGLRLDDGLKKIRATFHRVVYKDGSDDSSDPVEYEQVMDYVGRKGGGKGRRFSIGLGICGQAIRTGDLYVAERKNSDIGEYQKELIAEWGYTRAAAKSVSTEPMSWFASPLRDSATDKVIGIVYLDSTDQNAFVADSAKSAILTACLGVTSYVEKRYKS